MHISMYVLCVSFTFIMVTVTKYLFDHFQICIIRFKANNVITHSLFTITPKYSVVSGILRQK